MLITVIVAYDGRKGWRSGGGGRGGCVCHLQFLGRSGDVLSGRSLKNKISVEFGVALGSNR